MKLNLGPGYVPEFIRNGFCMRLPTAGEGVHKFLFRLARVLSSLANRSENPERSPSICSWLRTLRFGARNHGSNRGFAGSCVEAKRSLLFTPRENMVKAPSLWAPANQKLLRDICLEGPALGDLKAASPLQFTTATGRTPKR